MTEPRWIKAARREIGQREIPGQKSNPRILQWWSAIRAPFTDDETPWCAGFVGGMLESVGIKSSRSAAARSYLNWGQKLLNPAVGCIVVFERGPRNGHVGFLVGTDTRGNLMILGGNQGDAVNIKPFQKSRVLGYRWPTGEPKPGEQLAQIETHEEVSRAEDEGGPTKTHPKPKPRPTTLPEVEPVDAEEGPPPKRPKTWVTEVGSTATLGQAAETVSTVNTTINTINETKDSAEQLGMFDWLALLMANPRVLASLAVLLALVGGLIWWQVKKHRGQA